MAYERPVIYKNLKPHIADAIKESCYKSDARLYNIAKEVHNIPTFGVEPGVEVAEGLSKIINRTVKEAVAIDCDLAVISQGILIGAFRATPFLAQEAHKTIRILIKEILQAVVGSNGNVKKAVDGILGAIAIVAHESKLNVQEAVVVAREDVMLSARDIDPKLANDVEAMLKLDNAS